MGGIKIDLVANVSKFIGGTKDVEKALDDVADSLDDAAKHGDKLEKSFKENFSAAKTSAKQAGDAIGSNVKRGTKEAANGVEEFGKSTRNKAKEAAASFTGSFDNVGGFIQKTLSEALMGFGPAGVAAGLAAAVGIGVLTSEMQKAADKANKAKEETLSLADAIYKAGGNVERVDWESMFVEFAKGIADSKEWFEFWQKDFTSNLEFADQAAQRFGINFRDLFRGLAGDTEASQRALAEVNKLIAEQNRVVQKRIDSGGVETKADAERSKALADLATKLQTATDKTRNATRASELLAEVTGKTMVKSEQDYRSALLESLQAVKEWNNILDDRMGKLRELAGIQMSAEEAEAAWIKAQDESKKALEGTTGAVTKRREAWNLETEAGQKAAETTRDLAKRGLDFVDSLRKQGKSNEEVEAAAESVRKVFINTASQLGLNAQAAEILADKYKLIPRELATTAKLDTSGPIKSLEDYERRLEAAFGPRSSSMYDNWTFTAPPTFPTGGNQITVNIPTTVTTTFDPIETSRQIRWALEGT